MRILHTITVRELVEGYVHSEDEEVVAFGGKLDVRPKYQREFIQTRGIDLRFGV